MRKYLCALLAVLMMLGCVSASATDLGKYDEEVTLTLSISNGDATEHTLEIIGETQEDNLWSRLYKDELNINLEYKWIAKGEQAKQKLQMAIASDDLPDVFFVTVSDIGMLAEYGMIADMTDIYAEYASDDLRNVLEFQGGEMVLNTARVGGRLYGIPSVNPYLDSVSYFWIRQDWLDTVGMSAPTTMEELYKVAEAFTTMDPDGNGENDTFGLAFDKAVYNSGLTDGFFFGFGAYPSAWIADGDDGIVYGGIQNESREALRMLSDMYKKGFIDPEFGTKDEVKELELVSTEKIGMFYGRHWVPLMISLGENSETENLIAIPIPGTDGSVGKSLVTPNLNQGIAVVNANCEHPEAVVKMFNTFVWALWGEDTPYDNKTYYTAPEGGGGERYILGRMVAQPMDLNAKAFTDMWAAIDAGTTDQLTGSAATYYDSFTQFWCWQKMLNRGTGAWAVLSDVYIPQETFEYSAYVGSATPAQVERGSMLTDLQLTTYTKIVLGELNADADFDAFVKQWKELGGEQITKEINEAVQ